MPRIATGIRFEQENNGRVISRLRHHGITGHRTIAVANFTRFQKLISTDWGALPIVQAAAVIRTTPVAACTWPIIREDTGRIAIARITEQRIAGAVVPIVTSGWTITVTKLAVFGNRIPTNGGAIEIVVIITARYTTAIAVGA